MIKKGNSTQTACKQVDGSFIEKNDGTLEGSLTFTVDVRT